MTHFPTKVSAFAMILSLAACDPSPQWTSGDYEIYEISNGLKLGVDVGGGTQGLVMPQVIAVGEDARWIVAARHPGGDRSVTEYYYFLKAVGDSRTGSEKVEGPFRDDQFKQKTSELRLPPLTIRF